MSITREAQTTTRTVKVTLTRVYEVPEDTADPASRIEALKEWQEEDFESYVKHAYWEFEAN